MTLKQALDKSRRIARVDSTGKTDTELMDCVNESVKAFVKRVQDVAKSAYLEIDPVFNTSAFMALNVEIIGGANAMAATDVTAVIARENATGPALAGYLQDRLNAVIVGGSTTIVWDDTNWRFVLTIPGATQVTIADPVDKNWMSACCMLGASGTATGTTETIFYGSVPEDCTKKVDLPTDFLAILGNPEWDGDPIYPAPKSLFCSPEIFGEPTRYYIQQKTMLLSPSPNRQGSLRICYRYFPTEFDTVKGYQECGLTGLTYTTAIGISGQHSVDVSIDGAADVETVITIPSGAQWNAVLKLLNADTDGATWSLEDGDLRCTSDTEAEDSSIGLSAGSTGTDFLTAISATVETAVGPEYTTDVPIEDDYCMAVVYHVASQLLEESFESDLSMQALGQWSRLCQEYVVNRENQNTYIFPKNVNRNKWEVEPFAD